MTSDPVIVGLDASTGHCSVALAKGGAVIAQAQRSGRGHAGLLLGLIDQVLQQAGVARSAIDAIACTRGPGGFTGVRITVGVAQGLALGLDRPILPISTLQVVAESACQTLADHPDGVLVLQDARMQEVYGGLFQCAGSDAPTRTEPAGEEWVGAPSIPTLPPGRWVGAGSGFALYADTLNGSGDRLHGVVDPAPSMAAAMPIACQQFTAGLAICAHHIEPTYLRNRVADVPRS